MPLTDGPLIVVGAGIVGLATAYHLRRDGAEVTVIDRDPDGDRASHGNAGGIGVTEVIPASVPKLLWKVPGWLLDPFGPLAIRPRHAPRLIRWLWHFARAGRPAEMERIATALSALNSRVYDDLIPMLTSTGLVGELNRKGALTVYESRKSLENDSAEWNLKRLHGIQTDILGKSDILALEPALGPIVECGVFTPQWSHINDPKHLVTSLRTWLQAQGVVVVRGEVSAIGGTEPVAVTLTSGRSFTAPRVVVAAGAWSGHLAKRLGDKVLLESERGYNTTIPEPGVTLGREIIFAERKFVATPLSCGLRIGGTAEFGGLDAVADHRRSKALVTLASRYLPGLRATGGVEWAGHRPATPDSLPVIGASAINRNVLYAFGHGHLGLTQAATTGRLIADLVQRRPPPIDLTPYAITRFH
jgi:D-amino-acid dehydrogenase